MKPSAPCVWIPSAGSKAGLIDCMRQSLDQVGGHLIASDTQPDASAGRYAHAFAASPPTSDPAFLRWAQDLVQRYRITWIIPVREADFSFWSRFQSEVNQPQVLIASPTLLQHWRSKRTLARWLRSHNLPAVEEIAPSDLPEYPGPIILKPDTGSGSRGVQWFKNGDSAPGIIPGNVLAQPCIDGTEYTINLYFDPEGFCRAIIPHRRDAVAGGEVAKGTTVADSTLFQLARRLAQATHNQARGVLNFQVIRPANGRPDVITDLNPRFGGGYPLAHAAGARFTDWIVAEFFLGKPVPDTRWHPGTTMDRLLGNYPPEFSHPTHPTPLSGLE